MTSNHMVFRRSILSRRSALLSRRNIWRSRRTGRVPGERSIQSRQGRGPLVILLHGVGAAFHSLVHHSLPQVLAARRSRMRPRGGRAGGGSDRVGGGSVQQTGTYLNSLPLTQTTSVHCTECTDPYTLVMQLPLQAKNIHKKIC